MACPQRVRFVLDFDLLVIEQALNELSKVGRASRPFHWLYLCQNLPFDRAS